MNSEIYVIKADLNKYTNEVLNTLQAILQWQIENLEIYYSE